MEGDKRIFWRNGRLALLAGAAMTLSACAGMEHFEPGAGVGIDAQSPAAAAVQAEAAKPHPWPTFADIPPLPADVRDAAGWKVAVSDQEAEGLYTRRNAAEGTWSLTGTEAFAARAQAEINVIDVHAPTAAEIAESEAYARALRARATPPPPPR